MNHHKISKGGRSQALLDKAKFLFDEDMVPDQIYKVLEVMNQERCDPPLGPNKMNGIKKFIGKWNQRHV